jgi:hypothetical protein
MSMMFEPGSDAGFFMVTQSLYLVASFLRKTAYTFSHDAPAARFCDVIHCNLIPVNPLTKRATLQRTPVYGE